MNISYLMTAPPPPIPGTDAVVRDAEWLCSTFGGELTFLFPFSRPRPRFPRALYGLHRLRELRRLERSVDLHHLFHAELYPFPVLRGLTKPVVYSAVSGTAGQRAIPTARSIRNLARIVVPAPRDVERLADRGLEIGEVIPPAVDGSRLRHAPPPPGDDFVLLSGSSPWTTKQFRTKGVDALLHLAREAPRLKLVFLWRGLLRRELEERVHKSELVDRVEIIDEWVDVADVFARVHAAIVLADQPKLVKAFPDSLMEALVCGRPILVSDCLAMASVVTESSCGQVVRGVDVADASRKLARLRQDYPAAQRNALAVGRRFGSRDDRIACYRTLYESIIARTPSENV